MRTKAKRKISILAVLTLLATVLPAALVPAIAAAAGPSVFINELHYDNTGGDVGEFFEIAGPAGMDLTGWSVVLYNGSNGTVYNTIALTETITDQQAGFGTLSVDLPTNGLQNGSPDGIALVNSGGTVVEFLSYEGTFTAVGGPADTLTSMDIGVAESSSTAVGDSLQRTGSGTMGGDFTWAGPAAESPDNVNAGQTFEVITGPSDPVINEFVADHVSSDSEAFVEVLGDASTDYSAYTLLEIEGDSGNTGTIDAALNVGTTDASGYWIDDEDMENGSITILLVEGFTGSTGDDIDADDDGTIDFAPWTRIVDDVATSDGGGSDFVYSSSDLAPGYDGDSFQPGGASRIPNGTDTDATADWLRNDFHGFGFPGFPGTPAIGEAENTPGAVNVAITVATDPVGVCGNPATLIHDIQGAGLASSDVGSIREIEGVVVGDFQGFDALNGFFVQEEDADIDANGLTSEGIFVFDSANAVDLDLGDVVRVRGSVTEFFGLTEINNVANVIDCDSTGTASPATVNLPVTSQDDFEATEGMAVTLPQELFVSGNFTLGRFGEVDLSVGGPLNNPTNVAAPGTAANAVSDLNDLSRIQLDDGRTASNPIPLPPYFAADGTLRTGDSTTDISAVMSYSFGLYELHPTAPVDFTRNNVRSAPPEVGGSLQVGAYNVLNYFTTLDGAGSICGPTGGQGCRGADTAVEFDQQKAKITSAISTLDADVLGLMEIENNASDSVTADLVDGVNAISGAGTYDYVATGAIGTDAIRVALIYKPAMVTPLGAFAILDSSVDPTFDDGRNRPVLAQTFVENATGEVFTIAVNHLKSKGSNCNSVGDPDAGDEQGNCNLTRTAAALAEVNWLATDPTGSGSDNFLITGDMNAYAMEDPITTVEGAGYTDLVEAFVGTGFEDGAYSFNFFAESGYLDHALASESLTARVTGAGFWHVNSDEPSALDYNNFNQAALFNADEFRASDHDPVVIGLQLADPMGDKEDAVVLLDSLLPTGNKTTDKRINKAIDQINASLNPAWWTSLTEITNKKVFDRERSAVVQLELVVNSGVPQAGDAQTVIDVLVNADRQLAQVAINSAIAGAGDPIRIADAQAEMAEASIDEAAGLFNEAVNHYKTAWDQARKAL